MYRGKCILFQAKICKTLWNREILIKLNLAAPPPLSHAHQVMSAGFPTHSDILSLSRESQIDWNAHRYVLPLVCKIKH